MCQMYGDPNPVDGQSSVPEPRVEQCCCPIKVITIRLRYGDANHSRDLKMEREFGVFQTIQGRRVLHDPAADSRSEAPARLRVLEGLGLAGHVRALPCEPVPSLRFARSADRDCFRPVDVR